MVATVTKKTAIVLFNLGGPDKPESVQPFLFNLFNDKRIIGLPNPFRFLLAKLISKRRAPIAKEIYGHIGGKSPIVEETQAQCDALEKLLESEVGEFKTFIAMRYWHPFAFEAAQHVKAYAPDEIVLLPLYPQFSTTTVASSLEDWHTHANAIGLNIPTRTFGCYFNEPHFINAHVASIKESLQTAKTLGTPRVLFSAHGLPQKIVDAGDPYQWQVEQTADLIIAKLSEEGLDWKVSYQSRVGPLKWLEPNTEEEIKVAVHDDRIPVIVPIAFVSEHSETLVELDIEYKEIADEAGAKGYIRVPTLSLQEEFVKSLAHLCINGGEVGRVCSADKKRLCPEKFSQCPCDNGA